MGRRRHFQFMINSALKVAPEELLSIDDFILRTKDEFNFDQLIPFCRSFYHGSLLYVSPDMLDLFGHSDMQTFASDLDITYASLPGEHFILNKEGYSAAYWTRAREAFPGEDDVDTLEPGTAMARKMDLLGYPHPDDASYPVIQLSPRKCRKLMLEVDDGVDIMLDILLDAEDIILEYTRYRIAFAEAEYERFVTMFKQEENEDLEGLDVFL